MNTVELAAAALCQATEGAILVEDVQGESAFVLGVLCQELRRALAAQAVTRLLDAIDDGRTAWNADAIAPNFEEISA